MPTVLREGSFQVIFFSRDRGEPPHVHVKAGRKEAKFWLSYGDPPAVRLARGSSLAGHEVRRARRLVEKHKPYLLGKWHDHFND